ncbi:MAG: molybdenum cofactor guanylyltransferase [Porphyrobacter sp.]|nr:molybdenum cofactor guanylyltransferase [Porphyrobacter sp.]
MRVLGAVLAGGRSRRFGSDKALARYAGRPLLDHALRALAGQVDAVIVCGRAVDGLCCIDDRPRPGLGPLGGLNAALAHGGAWGFDAVCSIGCDTPLLPGDLVRRLMAQGCPAVVTDLPVIGLWPMTLAARLDRFLEESDDRSVRGWARICGAAALSLDSAIPNINRNEDLEHLIGLRGGSAATGDSRPLPAAGPRLR